MKRAAVILLVMALFASAALTAGAETTTLRVCWWGSQTRHNLTAKVIELFEQKNPGVKISPEPLNWNGYFDRLAAQAAGGNLPDVMQQDYKFITQYARSGLLLPLDEYINKGINLKDVSKNFIDPGRVDGKLYGINLGANTYVLIYPPELFKQAKVKEPTPTWDWEDFMDTCRKLHKALGIYASVDLPFTDNNLAGMEHYARQFGQKFFDPSGKKLGFDKKLFVEFYSMDVQLTKEGVFAPHSARLETRGAPEINLMTTGRSVMTSNWTNQIVTFTQAAGRPLKMALLPRHKKQKQWGTYIKPSMFFSITRDCKNKDLALKFIDFFTNDIEANKILAAERGVPISAKVRKAMAAEFEKGSPQEQMFAMIDLVPKYSSNIDEAPPEQYNQVIGILNDVHSKMLYGVLTPEQAADEFFERANKVLAGG